jgi:SRSO17 transposase
MNPDQIEALGERLVPYLAKFKDCFATECGRAHFQTYIQGQLGPLERKSIEPMADAAGIPPRSLQEFLSLLRWDEDAVRDRVQSLVARRAHHGEEILILDETSFAKKGDSTACVQRQYCGATGKIDNCVVTVNLAYADGNFHTLLDTDLYVPEEAWAADADRREKVGIPKSVRYRPIHEIALDQIEHARGRGVEARWVTADERYGSIPEFLETLETWGLQYVLEVPRSSSGWTAKPPLRVASEHKGTGRPNESGRLSGDAPKTRRAEELVEEDAAFARRPWTAYRVKDTFKGPEVWEVKETSFYQRRGRDVHGGYASPALRLIVARNVLDGVLKYFLSNAPPSVPMATLLRIAFERWRVERCFEDAKQEIGMDHFEVRRYGSIRRHLILAIVSLLFLALERERSRGGKDGVSVALAASARR